MARGLRNNNPGNIRRSAVRYKGETTGGDGAFKRFESAAWGYRAMFMLLHTYRVKHELGTLGRMIARYAPPSENDTAAYVAFVVSRTGIDANATLDTLDRGRMVAVVAAMSRMENGTDAVAADVEAGWELFIADVR